MKVWLLALVVLVLCGCSPPSTPAGCAVATPTWQDFWPPDDVIPTPIKPTPVPTLVWLTLEFPDQTCECSCRKVELEEVTNGSSQVHGR